MTSFYFVLYLLRIGCVQLPNPDSSMWVLPQLDPFHEVRATTTSLLLQWSPASHPFDQVDYYEVYVTVNNGSIHIPSASSADITALPWKRVYSGLGRQFLVNDLTRGSGYFARVRAVGLFSSSSFGLILTAHTLLPSHLERFPFELIGTGRNNMNYTRIAVDGNVIYERNDETGLVLGVFARHNLALHLLKTYNTFDSKTEADALASTLLGLDGKEFLIALVSIDQWELSVTPRLAAAVEFCGGFHFGQWAHTLSSSVRPSSPYSDLEETQGQSAFAHPYALIGVPGMGTGMGFESLQYNTGHYLTTNKVERAIIRGLFIYEYTTRAFNIHKVSRFTASLYAMQQPPKLSTVHNPLPMSKVVKPISYISKPGMYVPYIGILPTHIDSLLASNATNKIADFNATNYGFQIVIEMYLPQPKAFYDPRPYLITELERVWGGPSLRIDMKNQTTMTNVLHASLVHGLLIDQRVCVNSALKMRYTATNLLCQQGKCCPDYDDDHIAADAPLMRFGTGVWPTICKSCGGSGTVQTFQMFDPLPISTVG